MRDDCALNDNPEQVGLLRVNLAQPRGRKQYSETVVQAVVDDVNTIDIYKNKGCIV